MGWEGIHLFAFDLRAVRYGSHKLAARSPDISLVNLQLRQGARFCLEPALSFAAALLRSGGYLLLGVKMRGTESGQTYEEQTLRSLTAEKLKNTPELNPLTYH